MDNIIKRVNEKMGRDIRFPKIDTEEMELARKYGEHILETHFYKEPTNYDLTAEEENFVFAYITWKRFKTDDYKRKGFTEDDFILAEMEYEEYLESQKQ